MLLQGATKLCIIHVRSLILWDYIYMSAFSTYTFSKTKFSSFCVLDFRVSNSLVFGF